MNIFHGGRLATMPRKLVNEDGDLFLYRPLAFVAEAGCEAFSNAMAYPIIPCDICGTQEGLQRVQVKRMLGEWEQRSPGRRQVMFRALKNVRPSHLPDPSVVDFWGSAWGRAPQIVKIRNNFAFRINKPINSFRVTWRRRMGAWPARRWKGMR